ncbi:tniQ family protein [Collimonas arenae]|uniref:TniQ family protein n=1 Tax=Collimonas arenae TaxID=279058 RepID=A0A127QPP6_9BURK|nr:TniQ family protein [Collimonas arenae]AMP02135.1 tniQ family protein [Collimonas arenae]AMP12031.1 tniQ family protein [Collimonas arenae]
MLSGGLLPAHPKPQSDELFSSWLARVARANGQKLHTFCRMAFGEISIWNRDIDKSVTPNILAVLAGETGTSYQRAQQTSLASFEGYLYEQHNPSGTTPWILPAGVYHRVRRRYGLQFCPQCLASDNEPYFRRSWRIALYTACPLHGCRLLDRCPECGAVVMFHRRDFQDKENPDHESLTSCHACGFDLIFSPRINSDDSVVRFLQSVTQILSQGWGELPQFGVVYSVLYFEGIRHLMKLVTTDKYCSQRLRNIGLVTDLSKNVRGRSIEYLDIDARYEATRSVAEMILDWPIIFINDCKKANLYMAYLMKDFENAPWWYAAPVKWNLIHASYRPNKNEVDSVVSWLQSESIRVSAQRVSRLLGVRDSKLVKKIVAKGNGKKQTA